jgi:dipeptidyl aminopeptidase/acylaminoacyl peptidase
MRFGRLTWFVVLAILVPLITALVVAENTDKPKTLIKTEEYIPDIATFMQIGYCTPAGYTWDGKDVYITSGLSGAPQVFRILDSGWPYQLTTFEDGIDFFTLSWGGELGIVGASVGGSEDAQLYLMDTRTGQLHQLTDRERIRYGSVVFSRDDGSIFYYSNEENGRDFFIYRMDLSTGKATKVFGDTTEVGGYNVVADLSQDGEKLMVSNWTSNINNELYLIDLPTGEYQKITQDDTDVVYVSPTLMPDDKTIWLACNGNEDGIIRLARMEVGSPDVHFVDDGWIDPRWEIDGLNVSRDYKKMVALVNEEGYTRMKIREIDSKKQLPSPPLDGQLGGGTFDENGSMLISFSGPTRAPDVWRWNPQTEQLTQLSFSTYAGIDRDVFSEPELVKYESFDGLEIPAFLYLPPDYKPGTPIPFIVDAHGGPESQFQPAFIRNIQYLILNGFGVLAPNPRGSSGYGLHYLNLDNYKLRKNSLKDYRAGVDWLIKNNYTKKGMIGIRGGSYGGYVVLGMITEYPTLFDAAVDVVGIANFQTFLENTRAYRRALREAEYGPLSDPEFLAEISPIHKANLIKTPLLVVHGENDPRVPVGEARQIISAVQETGGVVDSLIFPDEGHGASKRVNIIAEYRKQVEFFNEHLKN